MLAIPLMLVALIGAGDGPSSLQRSTLQPSAMRTSQPASRQAPAHLDERPASARSMIRLREPDRAGPPATIADLAWLEGSWIGDMPQGPVEHVILGSRAGHMPSFVRALAGNDVSFYEISVFAESAGSLVNRVKHFTPELAGWEAQGAFVERRLVKRDGDRFYFDGLTFARTGPDSFTVYFLPVVDGRERETLVIPFRRVGQAVR
jgi:hypothetical protein